MSPEATTSGGPGSSPSRIDVVAGALCRPNGRVLLARRPPGGVHAGLWEFPGGKREAREPAPDALVRELREELGIVVQAPALLHEHVHRYADVVVRLSVFVIERWDGEPQGLEGQRLAWVAADALHVWPMPAADRPAADRLVRRISAPGTAACP